MSSLSITLLFLLVISFLLLVGAWIHITIKRKEVDKYKSSYKRRMKYLDELKTRISKNIESRH